MTLKGNLNPWNDMYYIVETISEFCVDEDQLKEMERQYIDSLVLPLLLPAHHRYVQFFLSLFDLLLVI